MLVLDDLHWAAKPTLLLLRHLLRFGEHARVQIVGTYRSTDLDRSHPLAAMLADLHRDGTANRISLSGLDEDDVTAYVAKAGYDDEELGRALASVTGGNPFFLIEALRHVDESGGVWDPSTLPQGVREAVSRRLSRLPAETNKALAAAAVVGSRFALDLVEHVVGERLRRRVRRGVQGRHRHRRARRSISVQPCDRPPVAACRTAFGAAHAVAPADRYDTGGRTRRRRRAAR